MVKVSIIMPIYNAESFLQKALESAITQSLKDIEILCVDDGSTDNSLKILKKISNKYPKIKIFRQENKGSGKARNYAIDIAKGEYIAFLDSDDMYINKDALKILYELASKYDADMVCGNLKRLNSNGKLEDNFNYKSGNYFYFEKHYAMLPEEYGIPWAFYKNIFKKSFLDKNNIRFNDLKRGQDPVFLAEILTKVDLIIGTNIDFYGYRVDNTNLCSKLNTYIKKYHHIYHFKETFDILIKGGLIETFEKFRPQLIYYLENTMKSNDLEVYEMALEIFGKNPKYFNEILKKRYDLFLTYNMVHKLYLNDNENFFNEIKSDLIEINILNNDLISAELMTNVMIILISDGYNEYKQNYKTVMMNYLNNKNTSLKNENKLLKDTLNILKSINRFNE